MAVKKQDKEMEGPYLPDETEFGKILLVKLASFAQGSHELVGGVKNPLVVIDIEHQVIHQGHTFQIRNWADVTDGTPRDFLITTPDSDTLIHMLWKFSGEGEFTIAMYEDVTVSANGTIQTPICMNRDLLHVSSVIVYIGPTVTNTGTNLTSEVIGSGKQASGEIEDHRGMVLKRNTKYLFRAAKIAAGTLWFNHHFQWNEVVEE